MTSFVPALFNPALGNDPCNGLLVVPGTNPCADAGFRGGTEGPNRSLPGAARTTRSRRAWASPGTCPATGKTAAARRLRPLLPARAAQRRPVASRTTRRSAGSRAASASSTRNAEPCDGCFGHRARAPPRADAIRSGRSPTPGSGTSASSSELLRNTTLELSYVGSKGKDQLHVLRRQPGARRRHQPQRRERPPGLHAGRRRHAPRRRPLRPYGVFGDGRIVIWGHDGESNYHSLQTQLVSRFGRGSQFQTSYTWSQVARARSRSTTAAASATTTASPTSATGTWTAGRTRTDRTHIFNASLVLVLPSLENKTGFVKNVFGDWEVASIVAAASGQAISVYTRAGSPGSTAALGHRLHRQPAAEPRRRACPAAPSGGNKEQILNPAAFTLNGFQLGTIGDAGRGICEGPGLFQVDLVALQEHQDQQEREGPAPVRGVQRPQPGELPRHRRRLNHNFNPSSVTYDTNDPATATTITGLHGAEQLRPVHRDT